MRKKGRGRELRSPTSWRVQRKEEAHSSKQLFFFFFCKCTESCVFFINSNYNTSCCCRHVHRRHRRWSRFLYLKNGTKFGKKAWWNEKKNKMRNCLEESLQVEVKNCHGVWLIIEINNFSLPFSNKHQYSTRSLSLSLSVYMCTSCVYLHK